MPLVNKVLLDLRTGEALKDPGDQKADLTVARVFLEAALSGPMDGQPFEPGKNAARYQLAVRLHQADIGEELSLSILMPEGEKLFDMEEELMKYVRSRFGPVVVGPLEIALSSQH